MRSEFIILFCFIFCCAAKAQDTICKRTGECFAARVLEIGLTEVQFRRADNPDGPLFIYNKNEIKSIRYASGAIDTFALLRPNPTPVFTKKAPSAFEYNNRIEPGVRSCVFFYRGRPLSDQGLVNMAFNRNEVWHDSQMDAEIKKTRDSKIMQYATGLGGIGIGIISLSAVSVYSGGNAGFQAGAGLLIAGLVVAAEVVSLHFKIERGRHARKLAALYNTHLY